jgi:hypothetical protein
MDCHVTSCELILLHTYCPNCVLAINCRSGGYLATLVSSKRFLLVAVESGLVEFVAFARITNSCNRGPNDNNVVIIVIFIIIIIIMNAEWRDTMHCLNHDSKTNGTRHG